MISGKNHTQNLPTDPLRVRLMRVRLPDGEIEVLATSILAEERLPTRLFKALDHRRWGTEEGDKRPKRWLEIENVCGRRVLAVPPDVHAKILALTLARMVRGHAWISCRLLPDRLSPWHWSQS